MVESISHITEANQELDRSYRILEGNNKMADILDGKEFQLLLEREKKLRGPAKGGVIECIDGRLPDVHIFGRAKNVSEMPASIIPITNDSGDPRMDAPRLEQTLLDTARLGEDRPLVQFIASHRSGTTDHNCGRVKLGQGKIPPEFDPELPPHVAARNIIINGTIPLIESTYKRLQLNEGMQPLDQVGVPIEIDTDTLGVELLGLKGEDGISSARELLTSYQYTNTVTGQSTNMLLKDRIELLAGKNLGKFGAHNEAFTKEESFLKYYSAVVSITEVLMNDTTNYIGLSNKVSRFIEANYNKLTEEQKQLVKFTMIRSVAMEYVTGLAAIPPGGPNHAFVHHDERAMAVAPGGKQIGRFSPGEQYFASTSSTDEAIIKDLHIGLSLLENNPKSKKPHIIFISESVNTKDWLSYDSLPQRRALQKQQGIPEEDRATDTSPAISTAIAKLRQLYNVIAADSAIKELMMDKKVEIYVLLVDENNGHTMDSKNYGTAYPHRFIFHR